MFIYNTHNKTKCLTSSKPARTHTCFSCLQCLIIILHPALIHYHNKIKSHIISNTASSISFYWAYKYKPQCQLTSFNSFLSLLLGQLTWCNVWFKLQNNGNKCTARITMTSGTRNFTANTLNALYKILMCTQVLMPLFQSVSVHGTNGCVVSVLTGLQEIRCCRSGWNHSFRVGHCSEELWLSCVSVFEDHNGGDVSTAIAVVRSRPHRDQLLIKHKLVSLMDKLMCPAD